MQALKRFFWTALILILFGGGIWLGVELSRIVKARAIVREENTATIVQQVQALSDFVTVKYVLEKVVILNAPPDSTLGKFVQGDNRVLLLAHGIVKAGIDLSEIRAEDVHISGKNISINLPMPHLTDAYLDEHQTKVIDWQRGFLRDFDKDLETSARQNAVDDLKRAARQEGILNDAIEHAHLELALFLHQAGFEQVKFDAISNRRR